MASPGLIPNPGLPMTAGMYYGKTMVMYTAGDRVECVVDGAPVGPNGRLFIVEPEDPTEVPWEAGRFMLEHLGYTGVVRVDVIETRNARGHLTGTEYDVEKAHAESVEKSRLADQTIWQQYISDMMEDYVARRDGKNKAVPPPPRRITRIIERRGYKLADYGIKPIGFEDPVDVKTREMESENKTLKAQMAELQAQMKTLIQMQAGGQRETQNAKDNENEANGEPDEPNGGNQQPEPSPRPRPGRRR
jgi:hypothetical protein